MPRFGFILVATLAVAAAVSPAAADDTGHNATGGDHSQTIQNQRCPVSVEEAIDSAIFTEYDGERVYFCCASCRTKFLANPEAYLDKLPQFAATPRQTSLPGAGAGPRPTPPEPALSSAGPPTGAGSPPSDEHAMEEGESSHEHDHATGHAAPGGLRRLVAYLGKLHPMAVHFPIGVLVAGALAELLAVVTHKESYTGIARFCVVVGALAALVTAGLGWAAGAYAHYAGDLANVLAYHRWSGTATGALAAGTAALAILGNPLKDRRGARAAYRVSLALTILAMTLAGYLGATLVYGVGHLSW